jgi:hypothetical protein
MKAPTGLARFQSRPYLQTPVVPPYIHRNTR